MISTINMVKTVTAKHGTTRDRLLPVLQEISNRAGFLTDELLLEVARTMGLPSAHVYGVASFYSFMDCKPRGRHVIRVCQTISCFMKGKDEIIKAIEAKLKIKMGETTPEGTFSLRKTNCIGWCHESPAILINDDFYTELTPEKVVEVLEGYL